MIIDHKSGVPLYRQLGDYLQQQIIESVYQPGDILPSEADLTRDFKLSRTTVRLAYDYIEKAGLVRRERGIGSIVITPPLRSKFSSLSSFTDEVRRLGRTPGTQCISALQAETPLRVMKQLQLACAENILKVIRLRTADDRPIGMTTTWLNTIKYPHLLNIDYSCLSLYEMYEKSLDLVILRAIEQVRADICNDADARYLKIDPGQPVLHITRTTYIASSEELGTPIEYVESTFIGSMYTIETELFRNK